MQILTSYFGFAKNFDPAMFALIGIAGKSPPGWTGLEYKKLAPSWSIWREWHDNRILATSPEAIEKVDDHYVERFTTEILRKLDPSVVVGEIRKLAAGKTPVLLCYEKPGEFCHRHLVAWWLRDYTEAMKENNAGFDDDIFVDEASAEIFEKKADSVVSREALNDNPDIPDYCKSCDSLLCGENGEIYCNNTWRITRIINGGVMNMAKIYAEWDKNGVKSLCFGNILDRFIEQLQEASALFQSYKNNDGMMPVAKDILFCPDHNGTSGRG